LIFIEYNFVIRALFFRHICSLWQYGVARNSLFFYSQEGGSDLTKNEIVALLKYDAWAITHVFRAVESLDATQYQQDMKATHGGIQGTISHIYAVQRLWLTRWTGKGANELSMVQLFQGELRGRWASLQAEQMVYVTERTDEELLAPFTYKDLRGTPFYQPLWQQVQHVVNHCSYHRGQITVMLRQCGVTPVQTDLIAYYRQH
jgi:uncharacterized damage-inducible protein DinB